MGIHQDISKTQLTEIILGYEALVSD